MSTPGIASISVQVTEEQSQYIFQRAERLGWKRMRFANAIILRWFESGCPPVSPVDEKFPPIPFSGHALKITDRSKPYELNPQKLARSK